MTGLGPSRSNARLWLLYGLFLAYATTIPFDFSLDLQAIALRLQRIPWNPLISPETGRRVSIPDVMQNVLLFVPFGVLGCMAVRPSRLVSRQGLLVIAIGAATSAVVEVLQLLTANRISSPSDVLANTAGTAAGLAVALTGRSAFAWAGAEVRRRGFGRTAATFPATVAVVVVVVAAWEPFDATLDVGTVATKVRMLLGDPWQAGVPRDEVSAALHFALFAWVAAAWLHDEKFPRPARRAAAVGVALALGLEASQLLISSRMPGAGDALVRSCGAGLGSAAWRFGAAVPARAWVAALAAGTAAAAAIMGLSPFEWAPDRTGLQSFLFLNYYARTSLQTVSHVLELSVLYFPLGFALGWCWAGRAPWVLALGGAGAIGLTVEYAQGWVTGRVPDMTDVGVSVLAAGVGVLTARRGRARTSGP